MADEGRRPLEPELIIPGESAAAASSELDPLARYHRLAWWLFVATCASTFFAGAIFHALPKTTLAQCLANGAAYSLCIMTILLAHEMGHYLQARRNRVPATPPLFIPMPITPMGTMGAVIVQSAGHADRKALFDIAVSGPLAGLVPAILAVAWGCRNLSAVEVSPGNLIFGDPLLVKLIVWLVKGPLPPGTELGMSDVSGAVFFAGWFGILVTGLNLIPLGQLDGGHILYALIGPRQHAVATFLFYGAIGFMLAGFASGRSSGESWLPMLLIVALMGIKHPPTKDDRVPLGPVRTAVGWFTLALLIVCFVPVPIYEAAGP